VFGLAMYSGTDHMLRNKNHAVRLGGGQPQHVAVVSGRKGAGERSRWRASNAHSMAKKCVI
jgi:hypothetical protein